MCSLFHFESSLVSELGISKVVSLRPLVSFLSFSWFAANRAQYCVFLAREISEGKKFWQKNVGDIFF